MYWVELLLLEWHSHPHSHRNTTKKTKNLEFAVVQRAQQTPPSPYTLGKEKESTLTLLALPRHVQVVLISHQELNK